MTDGAGIDGDDDAAPSANVDAASSCHPPRFALTNASGMPGDQDDVDDSEDIAITPQWSDEAECCDGFLWTNTRGDGEADVNNDHEDSGHAGT